MYCTLHPIPQRFPESIWPDIRGLSGPIYVTVICRQLAGWFSCERAKSDPINVASAVHCTDAYMRTHGIHDIHVESRMTVPAGIYRYKTTNLRAIKLTITLYCIYVYSATNLSRRSQAATHSKTWSYNSVFSPNASAVPYLDKYAIAQKITIS